MFIWKLVLWEEVRLVVELIGGGVSGTGIGWA